MMSKSQGKRSSFEGMRRKKEIEDARCRMRKEAVVRVDGHVGFGVSPAIG